MVILDALVFLVVCGLIALVGWGLTNWLGSKRGFSRAQSRQLLIERNLAVAALNRVAAGAAMPVLEAQEALDKINTIQIKELS